MYLISKLCTFTAEACSLLLLPEGGGSIDAVEQQGDAVLRLRCASSGRLQCANEPGSSRLQETHRLEVQRGVEDEKEEEGSKRSD